MSPYTLNVHQYKLSLRYLYPCLSHFALLRDNETTTRAQTEPRQREQSPTELNLLKPIAHEKREGAEQRENYTGKPRAGRKEREDEGGREKDLGVREHWSRARGSSYQGFGLTREFIIRTQHAGNKTQ